MGFLDHLEELRGVIIKTLGVFIVAVFGIIFILPELIAALNWPLQQALGPEHPLLKQALVTTTPMAVFTILIQICIFAGGALALPFGLYFFAGFVAPALTQREKHILLPCCIAVLVLFLCGAAFAYFLILPASLRVSIATSESLGLSILWTAADYYDFVVWVTLGIGAAFEFPLALVVLQYLGIVAPDTLRAYRRHAVVGILVLAMIATPPDVISQVILSIPLYLLYEAAIVVGERLAKKREAQLAAEAETES